MNWQQDPNGNWLARFVFPERTTRVLRHGRSPRRHVGHQSVRFLRRAGGDGTIRSPIRASSTRSSRPISARSRPGPLLTNLLHRSRASRMHIVDFLVALNQRLQKRHSLPDPHGSGRADAGGDAGRCASGSCRDSAWLLVQVLRHLGLAARFVSGYLIQLTPGPEVARRSVGHRRGLHRPACLGRGLSAGRRLDRARSDLRPAVRRRAHPAGGDAALSRRRADHRRRRAGRGRILLRDEASRASTKRRASPCRSPTRPGTRSMRSATRSMPILTAQDVRLTMGGEPTFVSIDDYQAAEWNTAARRPDQAHPRRRADPPPARPLRAGRPAALRPGQMVSGRTAAALGLLALWRRTASRSGRTPTLIAPRSAARDSTTDEAQRFTEGCAGAARHRRRRMCCRPSRIRRIGC